MLKIGITGGIGSGKSTVCEIFKVLGVPVYSADYEAKKLINTDYVLKTKIKELLGEEAYLNGTYNVPYVSKKVFKDHTLLTKLNGIVHPAVGNHFSQWASKQKNAPYCLKEAAIMQKGTGLEKIIYVHSQEETRITRTLERDPKRNKEQIKAIIKKQRSEDSFKAIADFIINNEEELLISQVLKVHDSILAAAANS